MYKLKWLANQESKPDQLPANEQLNKQLKQQKEDRDEGIHSDTFGFVGREPNSLQWNGGDDGR